MSDILPPPDDLQPPGPNLSPPDETLDVWRDRLIGTAATLIIALEVNPLTNDAIRVAAATAVGIATHSPEVVGLTMLGLTAAYEIPGAVATAWLLNTERAGLATQSVHEKIELIRRKMSRADVQPMQDISPITAAAIAMLAGPPALLAVKQTIDPSRTLAENVRYGTVSSSLVSLAVAAETYLVTAGIVDLTPEKIALAVVSIAGLAAILRYGWTRLHPNEEDTATGQLPDALDEN